MGALIKFFLPLSGVPICSLKNQREYSVKCASLFSSKVLPSKKVPKNSQKVNSFCLLELWPRWGRGASPAPLAWRHPGTGSSRRPAPAGAAERWWRWFDCDELCDLHFHFFHDSFPARHPQSEDHDHHLHCLHSRFPFPLVRGFHRYHHRWCSPAMPKIIDGSYQQQQQNLASSS